jgi:hypothetical protein
MITRLHVLGHAMAAPFLRPRPDQPWPPLTSIPELDAFRAWVIETRLRGEFSHDVCETTLEAIERRVAYLKTSPG